MYTTAVHIRNAFRSSSSNKKKKHHAVDVKEQYSYMNHLGRRTEPQSLGPEENR